MWRAAFFFGLLSYLVLQPETLLNNRYRVEGPIGEGGMATVYRAVDTRLGRTVAVKVLHPEFARDQPFLQRFEQEAEFAASLGSHPNIVAIYDIGQDGGLHYIVMELVDGQSLKALIRDRAPFSVEEAFGIGQQVASALDFAHGRGLVHRDVKPQNIVVTPDGIAKVTDFGIARSVTASQLTRTGMVIGTVHYFSPEQAQGKSAGPASDIYSLGIIVYEMLTGHLPFDAENAIGVAMQHLHSDPPPLWDFNPDLPRRAVDTVMRALAKDPNERYRDAAEFASAMATSASEPPSPDTTTVAPILEPTEQRTAVFEPVRPVPRRVVHETQPRRVATPVTPVAAPNRWRSTWIALGALLLAAAIAAAAYFLTNNAFSGSATATSTPTVSPTPTTSHKKKKHKSTPTSIPVVYVPTATFVPFAPSPTPKEIVPTSTPRPAPTSTPRPVEIPTSTPVPPTLAPTIELLGGPTATPTAFG